MSIFSKIKHFFSGSGTTGFDDDAGIVPASLAPYKIEAPVVAAVVPEVIKPVPAAITAKKKPAARQPKPAKSLRKTKSKLE
tara:strand:- start:513 stop:755 length:243 start_codon:yes stop_codon:yes gene_type:complete